MSTILIPEYLVNKYSLPSCFHCDANNVHDSFLSLSADYPVFKSFFYDDSGNIRRFINIFVDGEDIRLLSGPQTNVDPNSEISIFLAVAGG